MGPANIPALTSRTAVIFVALSLAACMKSPGTAGSPQVLSIPPGADNADVIWLVRPIETEAKALHSRGNTQVTLWGLFACYRSETPEPPQCFVAQVAGTKADLVWPDNPRRYKWRLDEG